MRKLNRNRSSKSAGDPVEAYNYSDDEQVYSTEKVPDTQDDDFYDDEVNQFHTEKEKILLGGGTSLDTADVESEQEEVLAFDDDSSSEDDVKYHEMKQRLKQLRSKGYHDKMGSDSEAEQGDEKPQEGDHSKVWGSERSRFYGGHDSDLDQDLSDSEPEATALEEEEALSIQRRLLQNMDEEDVNLEIFKMPTAQHDVTSAEMITQDLTKLSRRNKLQLVKKQSPELLELINDYKYRVTELQTHLLPTYKLITEKKLSKQSNGAKFVVSKVKVYLNYLMNFTYYLMLKAQQTQVEHHPVIKRLLQYRNIMKQMHSLETKFNPEIDALLQRIEENEEFLSVDDSSEEEAASQTKAVFKSKLLNGKKMTQLTGKKRCSDMLQDSVGEADINKGGQTWGRKKQRGNVMEVEATNEIVITSSDVVNGSEGAFEDERRAINYQIEKNKGLTTRKRKELRNPRVKNKLKYRKAKIRRRGQVREVRTEMEKYSGEIAGIRAGIKKSVKFK